MQEEIHTKIFTEELPPGSWKHPDKDIIQFAKREFMTEKDDGRHVLKYSYVDFQDMLISIKINRIISAENLEEL